MDKYKYRLIYPFASDKIYEGKNIKNIAEKCYEEIKRSNSIDPYFCILNMDNKHISTYEIPKNKKENGEKENINLYNSENLNLELNETTNTPELKQKIHKLEKELNDLYNKLDKKKSSKRVEGKYSPNLTYNGAIFEVNDDFDNIENNDDSACTIM